MRCECEDSQYLTQLVRSYLERGRNYRPSGITVAVRSSGNLGESDRHSRLWIATIANAVAKSLLLSKSTTTGHLQRSYLTGVGERVEFVVCCDQVRSSLFRNMT